MLEVLDISRAEVKRMVKRYTLTNYSNPDDILNQDYILVCYSINGDYFYDRTTYRIYYPACPSICGGGDWEYCQKKRYLDYDPEYVHFFSDGSSRIFCYEIWHLVDEFDEYYHEFEEMLYGVVNASLDDVLAIEVYERSFYPVTTYKRRKSDFALDFVSALSELRLAGCVENG